MGEGALRCSLNLSPNVLHTPSNVGVMARKTFSHTPDEAMSVGLVKACDLRKIYSVEEKISHFIEPVL